MNDAESWESRPDSRGPIIAVWRRKWLVALLVLIAAAGTLALSVTQKDEYHASAQVLLGLTDSHTQVSASSVSSEIALLQSGNVRELAAKKIGGDPGTITAGQQGQTSVIEVDATASTANRAQAIVDAWTRSYIEFRRSTVLTQTLQSVPTLRQQIGDLQTKIDSLNKQIEDQLPGGVPTAEQQAHANAAQDALIPQRNALLGQQAALQTALQNAQINAATDDGPQVITPAAASKVTPSVARNLMIGIAAGILLGVLLALLLEQFDETVRTGDDLRAAMPDDVPVLGVLPKVSGADRRALVAEASPRSAAADALWGMRAALHFSGFGAPKTRIEVVGVSQGDGATLTLANLGVMLARAGRRVVLVDANLRRPALHTVFGVDNRVGLTSVLMRDASREAAERPVPGLDKLSIVTSGPLPPNPSEVLSSPRFAALITALAGDDAIVLVDTAPALVGADAVAVAAAVDGVIVVTSTGRHRRRLVNEAIDRMRGSQATLIGTVLTGIAERSEDYSAVASAGVEIDLRDPAGSSGNVSPATPLPKAPDPATPASGSPVPESVPVGSVPAGTVEAGTVAAPPSSAPSTPPPTPPSGAPSTPRPTPPSSAPGPVRPTPPSGGGIGALRSAPSTDQSVPARPAPSQGVRITPPLAPSPKPTTPSAAGGSEGESAATPSELPDSGSTPS